jgi:hypothetical protein
VELSEELKQSARGIGDAAGRSAAQAGQVVESRTREEILAALLGLLGETSALSGLASDLYVRVSDWDGEV